MDKTQADAVAQAIMDPEVRIQEETSRKRAVEAALRARRQRVAGFSLIGAGVGAAIAYYAGFRFPLGVIYGVLAGSAVGWLVTRRVAA